MVKSRNSRAEEQFTAVQRKTKQALTEKQVAQSKRDELVTTLRGLRLAKEAADKQAAEIAAMEKAAAKVKKPRRPASPPPMPSQNTAEPDRGE